MAGLGDVDGMRKFVARTGVAGFPQLVDEAGAVWRRFGVVEQSSYVLVTADGTVVHRGFLDDRELAARVDQLVR